MLYIGDLVEAAISGGDEKMVELLKKCKTDKALKESVMGYLALKNQDCVDGDFAKEYVQENVKRIKEGFDATKKYLENVEINENSSDIRNLVVYGKADAEYYNSYKVVLESVQKASEPKLELTEDVDAELYEFAMKYSQTEEKETFIESLKRDAVKNVMEDIIGNSQSLDEAKKLAQAALNINNVESKEVDKIYELYKLSK